MLDRKRALKLRFRRHLRVQKRQVEELGAQAEERLENDFFKRLERLGIVRRFVATWLLLVVLLIGVVVAQIQSLSGYYQVLAAAPGGTYTEGVLGAFTNANPIYATDLADTSVAELVFAGLLTYNQSNQLTGDLAENWSVDEAGKQYTVTLKPNLTWHDGKPLTASDVAFTYQVIQNPDARSPLFNSWNGIVVAAKDTRTVTFTLPNPLASFPYSLTTGIVPQHILNGISMTDMRSVSFNSTRPVGAGPFQWQAIELTSGSADRRQEKIALKAFDHYHAGKPKLNGFVLRTFRSAEQLIQSFQKQEVAGVAGLTQVPEQLRGDGSVRVHNLPLTAAVMAFFRTQNSLLASTKIRQSLVAATDTQTVINGLQYPTTAIRQPLMRGQLAYDAVYNQAPYNQAEANKILEDDGWKLGQDGIRVKNGVQLAFNICFLDSPEYASVASQLAKQWHAVGAKVELLPQNEGDFQGMLSSVSDDNAFDVLLYGISLGVDPDVYVYWHGSQADPLASFRLNFSQYKSGQADAALEAGRTRLDPALRAVKYQPFLQAWQADAPALGLYQSRFLYLTHGTIDGLAETAINSDAGRFRNVHGWQIRKEWTAP